MLARLASLTALGLALSMAVVTTVPAAAQGQGPRFERRGSYAYYNGHRGYPRARPGYNYYNGYWFPPEAFIGALIGGALFGGMLANSSHLQWCASHYRSYQFSDDTYQPNYGPRRQCVSP